MLRWIAERWRRFWWGFLAPFKGLGYLLERPVLLKYALPPAVITAGLTIFSLALNFNYTDDLLSLVWAQPGTETWYDTWLLLPTWYFVWLSAVAVLAVVGIVFVYLLSIPLSGPFNELLSEKVEALETGFDPPFDMAVLIRNLAITALHVTLFFAIQVVVLAITTAVGFIPAVGQVLAPVISFFTTPLLVGFLPFDYPMTVRLWSFGDKMAFMWKHFSTFFGFSLAAFTMLYVPFLNLAFMPACVIAATLILIELQKKGELTTRDRRKEVLVRRNRVTVDASMSATPELVVGAEVPQTAPPSPLPLEPAVAPELEASEVEAPAVTAEKS